jgi:ribosomal protein L44E
MTKVGDKLMFYCVTCRKKHSSTVDKVLDKKGRKFAIGKCDKHGNAMWRILGKAG